MGAGPGGPWWKYTSMVLFMVLRARGLEYSKSESITSHELDKRQDRTRIAHSEYDFLRMAKSV